MLREPKYNRLQSFALTQLSALLKHMIYFINVLQPITLFSQYIDFNLDWKDNPANTTSRRTHKSLFDVEIICAIQLIPD